MAPTQSKQALHNVMWNKNDVLMGTYYYYITLYNMSRQQISAFVVSSLRDDAYCSARFKKPMSTFKRRTVIVGIIFSTTTNADMLSSCSSGGETRRNVVKKARKDRIPCYLPDGTKLPMTTSAGSTVIGWLVFRNTSVRTGDNDSVVFLWMYNTNWVLWFVKGCEYPSSSSCMTTTIIVAHHHIVVRPTIVCCFVIVLA